MFNVTFLLLFCRVVEILLAIHILLTVLYELVHRWPPKTDDFSIDVGGDRCRQLYSRGYEGVLRLKTVKKNAIHCDYKLRYF
jgi:hypothetical protein